MLDAADISTRLDRLLEITSKTDGKVDMLNGTVTKCADDVGKIRERMAVVERGLTSVEDELEEVTGPNKIPDTSLPLPASHPIIIQGERSRVFAGIPPFIWQALGGLIIAATSALGTYAATRPTITNQEPPAATTAPRGDASSIDGGQLVYTAGQVP